MRFVGGLLLITMTAGCQEGTSAIKPQGAVAAQPAAATGNDAALPPSLWTRKQGEDWPAFLGPRGDGKSAETGLALPWPKEGPKLLWKIRLGTGYCAPTVSRGRMFTFDRVGGSARLICWNAETAANLWKFDYPSDYEDLYGYDNGPRACPVVDGDRVYIYGAEGLLHCLSAVDGKLLWKVDTIKEFGVIQNFFGVGSAPVVEGELLLVAVGGSPPESAEVAPGQLNLVKPNGSAIVAFDKRTGTVKYRTGDDLSSYSVPHCATIGDRRWCFYYAREGLLGFNPSDGRQDFFFPWRAASLESVNASNPVVVGDEVFISETYGPGAALLKARPGKHEVVWADGLRDREKKMQTHWNTAVHVDGYLYGSSGRHSNNAELRCIKWDTGEVKWSQPGLSRSSLTYVDGHLICLTEYGDVLLLKANPEKFEVVSHFAPTTEDGQADPSNLGPPRLLAYPAWAAPIVTHGLMMVRGQGRVACFEIIPE